MGGAEGVICIKEILLTNRVSGTGIYVCGLDAVDDRYYILPTMMKTIYLTLTSFHNKRLVLEQNISNLNALLVKIDRPLSLKYYSD